MATDTDSTFEQDEKRAEEMLLDWLGDAEIGELSYLVFHRMKGALERLAAAHEPAPYIHLALADLVEAMRHQARFMVWVDDTCRRKGAPTLPEDDRVEIEAYAR